MQPLAAIDTEKIPTASKLVKTSGQSSGLNSNEGYEARKLQITSLDSNVMTDDDDSFSSIDSLSSDDSFRFTDSDAIPLENFRSVSESKIFNKKIISGAERTNSLLNSVKNIWKQPIMKQKREERSASMKLDPNNIHRLFSSDENRTGQKKPVFDLDKRDEFRSKRKPIKRNETHCPQSSAKEELSEERISVNIPKKSSSYDHGAPIASLGSVKETMFQPVPHLTPKPSTESNLGKQNMASMKSKDSMGKAQETREAQFDTTKSYGNIYDLGSSKEDEEQKEISPLKEVKQREKPPSFGQIFRQPSTVACTEQPITDANAVQPLSVANNMQPIVLANAEKISTASIAAKTFGESNGLKNKVFKLQNEETKARKLQINLLGKDVVMDDDDSFSSIDSLSSNASVSSKESAAIRREYLISGSASSGRAFRSKRKSVESNKSDNPPSAEKEEAYDERIPVDIPTTSSSYHRNESIHSLKSSKETMYQPVEPSTSKPTVEENMDSSSLEKEEDKPREIETKKLESGLTPISDDARYTAAIIKPTKSQAKRAEEVQEVLPESLLGIPEIFRQRFKQFSTSADAELSEESLVELENQETTISLSGIQRWLEEADILDYATLTVIDIGFCFFATTFEKKKRLTLDEFFIFLDMVARLRKMGFHVVINQLISCPLPKEISQPNNGSRNNDTYERRASSKK